MIAAASMSIIQSEWAAPNETFGPEHGIRYFLCLSGRLIPELDGLLQGIGWRLTRSGYGFIVQHTLAKLCPRKSV